MKELKKIPLFSPLPLSITPFYLVPLQNWQKLIIPLLFIKQLPSD